MTLPRAALVLVVLLAGTADAQPGKKRPATTPPAATAPASKPATKVRKAPTGKERIVGLLDVRGPTPADEATFEESLEEQLDTDTYWLAPRDILKERMHNSTKWTEGCVVHTCLQEVKVQTGADLVILAALTGSGTSFGFVVTVLRTDTGRVVAQRTARCDVCTFKETMTEAVLATIELLNNIPAKLPDEGAQAGAAVDVAVQSAVRPLEAQLAAARKHRKVGIVLTLLGVAVAGGGVAWYYLDDENKWGLATAAAGGGLAVGGVTVMTF